MAQIFVTDRNGNLETLDIRSGDTLMQAITEADFGDVMALCGGMCSCATCHVYIDNGFDGALPPGSEDERDLLEMSAHRRDNSRLSCQIPLTEELDGLRVTIAPED